MYTPDELPQHVILVGPEGEISVTDEALAEKAKFLPENAETYLGSTVLPRHSSSFLASRPTSTQGVIVVSLARREGLHARITGVDEHGAIQTLGECPVSLDSSQVSQVSCILSTSSHDHFTDGPRHDMQQYRIPKHP